MKRLLMVLLLLFFITGCKEKEIEEEIPKVVTKVVEKEVIEPEEVEEETTTQYLNETLYAYGKGSKLSVTFEDGYITYNSIYVYQLRKTTVYGTYIMIDVEDKQYTINDYDYINEKMYDFIN